MSARSTASLTIHLEVQGSLSADPPCEWRRRRRRGGSGGGGGRRRTGRSHRGRAGCRGQADRSSGTPRHRRAGRPRGFRPHGLPRRDRVERVRSLDIILNNMGGTMPRRRLDTSPRFLEEALRFTSRQPALIQAGRPRMLEGDHSSGAWSASRRHGARGRSRLGGV